MQDDDRQEIIIVKRYTDGDGGHHGGAWKIAFADFMTAMMALFLVLWLVNAANEETKKSVASYFNPVKLVDRNRSSKGLQDATIPNSQGKDGDKKSDAGRSNSEEETENTASDDAALFKDPFQVLNQLAKQASEEVEKAEFIAEQTRVSGSPSEDAFLDPFAQATVQTEEKETGIEDDTPVEAAAENLGQPPNVDQTIVSVVPKTAVVKADKLEEKNPQEEMEKRAEDKSVERQKENPQQKSEQEKAKEKRIAKLKRLSAEILEEIKESLRNTLGPDEQLSESLSVLQTKDGILISITDQFGFSMFQLGSALPKGQFVLAMKEVSDILSKRDGMIRVYGHTDARPYGGDAYDNWRLSTARAHAARLMLARGGLKTKRVSQVVGFADRNLKERSQPESEVNRRIEILLEVL